MPSTQAAWTRPTADIGWELLSLRASPPKLDLEDVEALGLDALLHLGEVGLTGGPVAVSADLSEVRVTPEVLQVPLGVILDWSSRAFRVEVYPEDGMDRS